MFCTFCGRQYADGTRFCIKCGHPTSATTSTSDAPHAPVPPPSGAAQRAPAQLKKGFSVDGIPTRWVVFTGSLLGLTLILITVVWFLMRVGQEALHPLPS